MDRAPQIAASLGDIALRLNRIEESLGRLAEQKIPDQFVPISEAIRHLHCGRDWLVAQIRAGVLRRGVDYLDRTSGGSTRRRYLVNPVSALRWLNGSRPVGVRTIRANSPNSAAAP